MEQIQRDFIPAAGHDWVLPLYDPMMKLLGGDEARRTLVEGARLNPGQRILDIGCGTGSLLVLIKCLYPESAVLGVDPDPKALARARRKAESVRLDPLRSRLFPQPALWRRLHRSSAFIVYVAPSYGRREEADIGGGSASVATRRPFLLVGFRRTGVR